MSQQHNIKIGLIIPNNNKGPAENYGTANKMADFYTVKFVHLTGYITILFCPLPIQTAQQKHLFTSLAT
jgi:hypothetical protein